MSKPKTPQSAVPTPYTPLYHLNQRVIVTTEPSAFNGMIGVVHALPATPDDCYMVHFSAGQMRLCLEPQRVAKGDHARTVAFWQAELEAL